MKESTKAKSQRILDVLLTGKKITPYEANMIADTTDGTRYIRFLREKYPIKDEKVENELSTATGLMTSSSTNGGRVRERKCRQAH